MLRMKKYRDLVKNNAINFRKLEIVDPMPYLCAEDECITFKDGNFLYADDDHFSVYGAKYMANKINGVVFNER